MLAYAGIGSRQISDEERNLIHKLAKALSHKFILYSGNADGADIAFQTGSENKCVLILPWKNFNKNNYDHNRCIAKFDCGDTIEGNESISKFHPAPSALTQGGRRMICRNWHQINGYDIYPIVKLVICCANVDSGGKIIGGTGQACRIAEHFKIPVVNIRSLNWNEKLCYSLSMTKENTSETSISESSED